MHGNVWQTLPHVLSRRSGVRISAGRAAPLFSRGMKRRKSRVPDTFQLSAISAFSDFCASSKINNLRVFNGQDIPTPPASTIFRPGGRLSWRGAARSAESIAEPCCGANFRFRGFFFPISRRRVRFERMQEAARNGLYFVDCGQECGFVCLRWLVEAANFSHELQRRSSDLVRCDGRIKVEKRFDIPAHSCDLN